jgi:hypothetical protein
MKFSPLKIYALTTGSLLFAFGFIGFAFRAFDVADHYLFLSLVLGFWGIIVGTKK